MSSTLSVAALSIAFGICVGSLIWGAFALGSRLTVAVRARVDGIVTVSYTHLTLPTILLV